jgi:hypothetical protein
MPVKEGKRFWVFNENGRTGGAEIGKEVLSDPSWSLPEAANRKERGWFAVDWWLQ